MARSNSGNLFEYILEQVNIIDVIRSYITVENSGKNYKTLCPFHSEKTPSFIISEDKQLYHCFGCGAAGNAINFVMQYDNLDAIDAAEKLSDQYHIDLSQFKNNNSVKNNQRHYDLLKDAAIYYYKNLRQHPEAINYLQSRGIQYDIVKKFGLGFANDAWQDTINYLKKKYTLKEIESTGIAIKGKKENQYYDRFRNRIIYPIINPKGKIIGFGGRVMDDSLPKYLNSPETEIFNKSQTLYGLNLAKDHLHDSKTLIITEGYMDVIALHSHGINNAVATLGTALTKEHGRLMKRYADDIIICYDSDFAGQKATLRSLDVLEGLVDKIRIIVLGENLDPDDFIKKYGVDKFNQKINRAVPATEYRLDHLKQGYNVKDEQQKIEFLSKAVVIIRALTNEFEKNLYVEKLSNELNVNSELIAKEVYMAAYDTKQRYGFSNKTKTNVTDKHKFLEFQLLTYYIYHQNLMSDHQKKLMDQFVFSKEAQAIYDYLSSYYATHPSFEKQFVIENADIEISTQLMTILEEYDESIENLNVDQLMNLILLNQYENKLELINQKIKDNSTPELISEWQALIIKKNQIKKNTQNRKPS